ncbi:MAG: DEAD/DEAH box helicase [Methanobacteriaceae archaeon]|jgi:SNF2 family DNA or RNA helicase|nr:DEAD/DEAH box helicase [Methanobacteriaceae archaeon]
MDFCKDCGLIEKYCTCKNKNLKTNLKMIRFYIEDDKLLTAWIQNNKVKNRKGKDIDCIICDNPLVYKKNRIFCPNCNREYNLFKKFFQDKKENSKNKNLKYGQKVKNINDILDSKFKGGHVKAFEKSEFQSDLFQFQNNNFKREKLEPIDFSYIPNLSDEIFLLLTSNPEFYSEEFKLLLKKIYDNFSIFNRKIQKDYESIKDFNIDDYLKEDEANNWREFIVNLDGDYSISNIILDDDKTFRNDDYSTEEVLFRFLNFSNLNNVNYNLQYWILIAKFTSKLIENHALIPEIIELESEKFHIRWIPAIFNEDISRISEKFLSSCPNDLIVYNGSRISKKQQFLTGISIVLDGFIEIFKKNGICDELKSNLSSKIFSLFLNEKIMLNGEEEIINHWLINLKRNKSSYELILAIQSYKTELFMELLVKFKDRSPESFSLGISKKNDAIKDNLKSDLDIIRELIPEIGDGINIKRLNIDLDIEELSDFLKKIEELSKVLGISIVLPRNLEQIFKPKLALKFKGNINKKSEFFSIEELVDFDWEIAVGSKNYTKIEFEKLLNNSEKLIDLKVLNEENVNFTLKELKNAPKKLSKNELLQGLFSGEIDEINVKVDTSLDNLIEKIKNYEKVEIPDSLNGELRDYQKEGFYWLIQNIQLGFGSILADDMGLGKTIQVLTAILYLKENSYLDDGKVLVIAPTSLLYNWEKEIEKFTPSLKSFIYHKQNRQFPKDDFDILLTSYGVLRYDYKKFKKLNWFLLVVDEAQNIKNPNAKQTKALKTIRADNKIALTGTPVENRLLEYWSIFDFTNKSYLYSSKKFKQRFINPIEKEKDDDVLNNFKQLTSPFILRRLKNDSKIITDLPDKNISDIYCNLTGEQAALYQKTLESEMDEISYELGINRKGLIFKLMNSLKQICNHPSQFMKNKSYKIQDSGKMEVLIEILENIEEMGEKTLIFTQYVQMGKIMKKILEKKFKKEILFLHGSLTREKRDKMINEFQNDPSKKIFILSLKVGGIGLNLTAAQNVIHYDLWWNPAVENQATDRAYRIGQKENVMVYRLITSGTFEERINELIKEKEELAELAIGNNEKFLTEMSNDELKNMFSLR